MNVPTRQLSVTFTVWVDWAVGVPPKSFVACWGLTNNKGQEKQKSCFRLLHRINWATTTSTLELIAIVNGSFLGDKTWLIIPWKNCKQFQEKVADNALKFSRGWERKSKRKLWCWQRWYQMFLASQCTSLFVATCWKMKGTHRKQDFQRRIAICRMMGWYQKGEQCLVWRFILKCCIKCSISDSSKQPIFWSLSEFPISTAQEIRMES